MVHTHLRHGGISRGGRNDDTFDYTFQISPNILHDGEDTSGLHNRFGINITQFDVGKISRLENEDGFLIDDKFPIFSLDCAMELAVSRIRLERVDHVAKVNERVTDADNIHFARVKSRLGGKVPNMAKSVHSDLHHHISGMCWHCRKRGSCLSNAEQRALCLFS